jgi:large subunit ribosomal protein L5
MKPRFQEIYESKVRAELQKEFGYTNAMQVPMIQKVVINMGLGDATSDSKVVDAAVEDLALIAGQRPVTTRARQSIAA